MFKNYRLSVAARVQVSAPSCYMKNTILYEYSCLNMSTAANRCTMSKNVDELSFFKKIE